MFADVCLYKIIYIWNWRMYGICGKCIECALGAFFLLLIPFLWLNIPLPLFDLNRSDVDYQFIRSVVIFTSDLDIW